MLLQLDYTVRIKCLVQGYDTNKLLVSHYDSVFGGVVGVGAGEAGQEETGEHGLLSNAGGGEIKRGNVTIERRTLCNTREAH